jgi:hypothetical protein
VLLVWRSYKFSCSSCRRIYATKFSPVLLGTGRRRCKACGTVFHDGCKEWPELTGQQKFQYFFPITVLACFLAAVAVALASVVIFHDEMSIGLELATFVFLIVMLPWVPYVVLQWRQISVSQARFAWRRVFGETDESVLST